MVGWEGLYLSARGKERILLIELNSRVGLMYGYPTYIARVSF